MSKSKSALYCCWLCHVTRSSLSFTFTPNITLAKCPNIHVLIHVFLLSSSHKFALFLTCLLTYNMFWLQNVTHVQLETMTLRDGISDPGQRPIVETHNLPSGHSLAALTWASDNQVLWELSWSGPLSFSGQGS